MLKELNMLQKRVKILGGGSYTRMFQEAGYIVTNTDPDFIVFTGGTDVDPTLYGQQPNRQTGYADKGRDEVEKQIFQRALADKIPMVGICRGAQFLCVMSGGKLYQHVEGHLGSHQATADDGATYLVTSTHHQMMNPSKVGHKVLMGTTNLSNIYLEEKEVDKPVMDYEVVYFTNTNCLASQPHPEMMDPKSPYHKWFLDKVDQLLDGDL